MVDYLGLEFLDDLKSHYQRRLSLAIEKGYTEVGNQYYWLYEELQIRVLTVSQVKRFLLALPVFMVHATEEQIFQYVMGYATAFFKPDIMGEIPRDAQDQHPYFNDNNPYWIQMNEALDAMGPKYDTTLLPLLYIDLSEFVVRSVRLYYYIREHEIHAIDRGKFDQLMKLTGAFASSA